ncbi:calcineurin subunit B type 2-like [Chenopodium quinoa]|nr:calcineurin subunit B type 2-like [Chenopodium quinoa]
MKYDICYCFNIVNKQERVSLYQRFCQLDRTAKGFISSDEFMSVPEFAMNPFAEKLLKMVDGLNFKDFVAFLSAFSAKASIEPKASLIFRVYDSNGNGKVTFNDVIEVLSDMTGSFMTAEQREFMWFDTNDMTFTFPLHDDHSSSTETFKKQMMNDIG